MRHKALLLFAFSLSVFLFVFLLPGLMPASNAAPAAPAAGEDDRESSTPTAWYWYYGQTEADITHILTSTNSRLIDIGVETTTVPHKFSGVFVENTGVYAKSWYWYFDQTAAQVRTIISDTNNRIISLKAYELSPGDVRFAFVSISNTGADNKAWWWYFDQTPADVTANLAAHNARLVQIHQYTANGQTRYAVVMISNTGADNKAWWYYYGQTPGQIGTLVNTHSARVTDLDYDAVSGNYNVIMEYWPTQPPNWWHLYGVSASQLGDYINQFAGRIIDLNRCGADCFSVAMLDNADPITSRVGHMLRTGIGGQADGNTVAVGLYLKEAGQPPLAALEPNFAYQPASSIKVAEHLYVMRRVQAGTSSPNDPIVHYTNGADSCPNPPVVSGTEPLTTALKNMMRYSDNARTR